MAVRICLEIGHEASIRTKKTQEGFTHDWEVFVRGCDGADIHCYVEKVVFYLHETFPKPRRVVKEPPYTVKESGYAGFNLPIDIYLKNNSEPKKVRFNYDLNLQQTGPAICKVQKEKYVFNSPTEEFRHKLLKGGGTVGNGSSQESGTDSGRSYEEKNQLISKPKLSGSSGDLKKLKKTDQPSTDFKELFGLPIIKPSVEPRHQPPPKQETRDFMKLFGSPIITSSKSNTEQKQAVKPDTGGADKPRTKHDHKESKQQDKSDHRKSKDDKLNKPSQRDKDRGDKDQSNKEKPNGKDRERNNTKTEKNARRETKSPFRTKSPSPRSPKRSSGGVGSPARFSSPKHNNNNNNNKEVRHSGSDKRDERKSRKEKKSKDRDHGKEKDGGSRHGGGGGVGDEVQKSDDHKKVKARSDVMATSPPPPPPPPQVTSHTSSSSISKSTSKKEKVKDRPPKEQEKTSTEKPYSDKYSNNTNTTKHKKKDKIEDKERDKDKDKKEKKQEEKLQPQKNEKKVGKDKASTSLSLNNNVSDVESGKSRAFSSKSQPIRREKIDKESSKKKEKISSPTIDDDSSNSSSTSSTSSSSDTEDPPKKTKNETTKAPEPVVSTKNSKVRKEKGYEENAIKCKRKSSNVETEEPPEKMKRDTSFNDSSDCEPEREEKKVEEDYFSMLRDLQTKIMSLKDNSDLQKVVQLIAETGRYEVSAHTFDFDLCLLDRSTVQQLREFFANAN